MNFFLPLLGLFFAFVQGGAIAEAVNLPLFCELHAHPKGAEQGLTLPIYRVGRDHQERIAAERIVVLSEESARDGGESIVYVRYYRLSPRPLVSALLPQSLDARLIRFARLTVEAHRQFQAELQRQGLVDLHARLEPTFPQVPEIGVDEVSGLEAGSVVLADGRFYVVLERSRAVVERGWSVPNFKVAEVRGFPEVGATLAMRTGELAIEPNVGYIRLNGVRVASLQDFGRVALSASGGSIVDNSRVRSAADFAIMEPRVGLSGFRLDETAASTGARR